jgi:hypothetical protein
MKLDKMKVQNCFLFLFLLTGADLFAQTTSTTQRENIEAQRIAFITQELQLTSQEAQEFGPSIINIAQSLLPCVRDDLRGLWQIRKILMRFLRKK